MNYPGYANKVWEEGPHVDTLHNHLYLSFGPGWYVVPYAIFSALNIPPSPLGLQIISLIISAITAVLLFRLLRKITPNAEIAFAGTLVFATLPGPLWYGGNGYVTTAIMLPFVLIILDVWHWFSLSPKQITFGNLCLLAFSSIALTYIDWLTPFLLAGLGLWSVLQLKKDRKYAWVLLVCMASCVLGIVLVLYQFAQYIGWGQVMTYWRERFAERSNSVIQNTSVTTMLFMVAKNVATAMLPLVVLGIVFFTGNKKNIPFQKNNWLFYALASVCIYNAIFFNWSTEHEFAWMAFALVFTIAITVFILPLFTPKQLNISSTITVIFSLLMYYAVNRPGPISQNGTPYNAQKLLGQKINKSIDHETVVFTNDNNNKIVEYYAKRTFNHCENKLVAHQVMQHYQIPKAYWLQIDSNKLTAINLMTIK